MSPADFAQPHKGKILGMKRSSTLNSPKLQKGTEVATFLWFYPSPQPRTWPSLIFTSPFPHQEWQLGKQNHQRTDPPSLPTGALSLQGSWEQRFGCHLAKCWRVWTECAFALFKEKTVPRYCEEQGPAQQRDLELKEPFIRESGHTRPKTTIKTGLGNRKLFIKQDFLWGH